MSSVNRNFAPRGMVIRSAITPKVFTLNDGVSDKLVLTTYGNGILGLAGVNTAAINAAVSLGQKTITAAIKQGGQHNITGLSIEFIRFISKLLYGNINYIISPVVTVPGVAQQVQLSTYSLTDICTKVANGTSFYSDGYPVTYILTQPLIIKFRNPVGGYETVEILNALEGCCAEGAGGTGAALPEGVEYSDYLYWDSANGGDWLVGRNEVHLGAFAGATGQNAYAIAIGAGSGQISQGTGAVALGLAAGVFEQGAGAVAVGSFAGNTGQGITAVAVGSYAGQVEQGTGAVAMGYNAGQYVQGTGAVAVGFNAGKNNQGYDSIAIGPGAGENNQTNNSIILNASGTNVNTDIGVTTDPSTQIAQLRGATGPNVVLYNPSSSATGGVLPYEVVSQPLTSMAPYGIFAPSYGKYAHYSAKIVLGTAGTGTIPIDTSVGLYNIGPEASGTGIAIDMTGTYMMSARARYTDTAGGAVVTSYKVNGINTGYAYDTYCPPGGTAVELSFNEIVDIPGAGTTVITFEAEGNPTTTLIGGAPNFVVTIHRIA